MLPLRNIAFTLVRRNLPLYRLNPPQRTIANATTKPHKKPSIKRTPEERKAAADPRKKLMPPPKKEKPPPDTSKLYENGYTTKSTVPTFIFQKSLPHLPVPPLDETCTKFEEACNPLLRYLIVFFALDNHPQSDTEIEETQSVIRDFKEKLGPKLQEQLIEYDKKNLDSNYVAGMLYNWSLENRSPLAVLNNPYVVLPDHPNPKMNDQLTRATSLIISALRFKRALEAGVMVPSVRQTGNPLSGPRRLMLRWAPTPALKYKLAKSFGTQPLDMTQYGYIFGGTRLPRTNRDILETVHGSKHIIVIRNGHIYRVSVIKDNGDSFSAGQIGAQLRFIMSDATQPSDDPLGVLTSGDRDDWTHTRTLLTVKNNPILREIDRALFVVCLDTTKPLDDEEYGRLFLHGDPRNRWFDKSVSFIVAPSGKTAINFERSWGDDPVIARFLNDLHMDLLNAPVPVIPKATVSSSLEPIKLEITSSERVRDAMRSTDKMMTGLTNALVLKTENFKEFGQEFLSKMRLAGDSVMQMAIQLAYIKMTGRIGSTYQPISTSQFSFGRTEPVRPLTLHTLNFAKQFMNSEASDEEKETAFRMAVIRHGELLEDAANGKGFERHLFALSVLARAQKLKVPLFNSKAYKVLNHNAIYTNHFSSLGAESMGVGPVVEDGYGIGYCVHDDRLVWSVTGFSSRTTRFSDLIKESLVEIQQILIKTNN